MEPENAVAELTSRGEVAYGIAVESGSPMLVEVCGGLGADWIWIDFEHKNVSPDDSGYLENLARAAECAGTELVVRVPRSDPALVRKVLDAGVRNVLVPRVTTAEEVRDVVAAGRFEYDGGPGKRGLGFGRSCAYGAFMDRTPGEPRYDDQEDEHTRIGLLIEEQEALENLEEILSVPEIGFVLPGPGDLSIQLGHPMDYGHPAVTGAVSRIREACLTRDIPVMGLFGSHFDTMAELNDAIERGYTMIGLGSEVGALRDVVGDRMDVAKD